MLDDVFSSMLSQWLKKQIRKRPIWDKRLKLLANCMTYGDAYKGVQVISNGTETRILGARPCQHSWACPECTARKMAKYSTRIAAAIDALAKKGYSAAMFTMTVFHTNHQSCEDTYFLLRKAWELMDKQKTWRRKKKDGTYYVNSGRWSKFQNEFQFKHSVKTMEITFGEHGWHPHIHMLIWFKNADLQKLADWESTLIEEWNCQVDRAAKLLYGEQSDKYRIRKFLEAKTNRPDFEHLGLHISKTEEGKIRAISSADYLCGFGGENELTGLGKIAHKGHMTPFQMLESAHNAKDEQQREYLLNKYFEFAWAVIKNRISRIQFSRTGLKAIIDTHLQTEEFRSIIKKKKEKLSIAAFQNIAWFSSKQWHEISFNDNEYVIPLIKIFATYEDGFNLICELLIANNLPPPVFQKSPAVDYAKLFNEIIAA